MPKGNKSTSKLEGDNNKFLAAKEKYKKQYEQYSKLDDKELEKAIKSHEKRIRQHEGFITDPVKRLEHAPDWNNLDPRRQKNLLEHHWPQDIERHRTFKEIAEGILKERGKR